MSQLIDCLSGVTIMFGFIIGLTTMSLVFYNLITLIKETHKTSTEEIETFDDLFS